MVDLLPLDAVLGAGTPYNVVGLWRGKALRPAAHTLAERYDAAGYTAFFMDADNPLIGGSPTDLAGLVKTEKNGVTVTQVLRVMGLMGATGGGVYLSTMTGSQLEAMAGGDSVGELGGDLAVTVREATEAADDITDIVSVAVRNWPITLALAVLAFLFLTGRIRI